MADAFSNTGRRSGTPTVRPIPCRFAPNGSTRCWPKSWKAISTRSDAQSGGVYVAESVSATVDSGRRQRQQSSHRFRRGLLWAAGGALLVEIIAAAPVAADAKG